MIRSLLCTVVAFGGLLAGGNALAEDANISHVKVALSDQQLNDPAQTGAVYAKLYKAVQTACQSEGEGPSYRLADDRACEAEAMSGVVRQLNGQASDAQLAQRAEKRSGSVVTSRLANGG